MCFFQNKLQLPWVTLHGISLPDELLRNMFALGIRWPASGLATGEHFNTDSQLQTPQREWMSTSWYQTQRATLVGEKTRSKSSEENVRIGPLMTKDFSVLLYRDTMYSRPIVRSPFPFILSPSLHPNDSSYFPVRVGGLHRLNSIWHYWDTNHAGTSPFSAFRDGIKKERSTDTALFINTKANLNA